jgi:hypothetical protein
MAATIVSEMSRKTNEVSTWPRFPSVYEINTWVWLSDLSQKYQTPIDLSCVPSTEWEAIAGYGFDAVWLMGVWERSPLGISIANRNENLVKSFRQALVDFQPEDNVGSPYCVRRYVVDQHLGGQEGLAIARRELQVRGIKLILDFVPNHVAPDHPSTTKHPEYFIPGRPDDLEKDPASCIQVGGNLYACGRDPFFPAWPDVLQLNAFNSGLRIAVGKTLAAIAQQCDGVRCDMAMLFINSVFQRTWAGRCGPAPAGEYWAELISATKKDFPDFIFIAEAYWDLEWELQQQGFDFCYDKKLYDRLEHKDAENVRLHLCADMGYQEKLVRFIENHDEPRAASAFLAPKQRVAAVATITLPGMKLLHEGQLEGRKVRLPVFLGRRPEEAPDSQLQMFYGKLLEIVNDPAFHRGDWTLSARSGWPDNSTFQNLVAWSWQSDQDYLVVVNLSDHYSQARVQLSWPKLHDCTWSLTDTLSDFSCIRDGNEMLSSGLYVELGPWGYHLFRCEPKTNN